MRRYSVLLALPLLILTACGPTPDPAPAPTDDSPATSKPTETIAPTAPELGPDVLLLVSATATADNGAVLDLTMTVHKATAWSDTSAPDRPEAMTQGCEGYLDASVYEANLWSFLSVEVSAEPTGTATWPADKRIRLFPVHNDDVSFASSGFLVEDPDVDGATPHCARDRYLYGAGDGVLIAGIQGDTDEAGAAGNFTRWANQLYGFVGREVAGQTAADAGITISGCTFTVTPAGAELNGGADWWSEHIDESNCYVGSA